MALPALLDDSGAAQQMKSGARMTYTRGAIERELQVVQNLLRAIRTDDPVLRVNYLDDLCNQAHASIDRAVAFIQQLSADLALSSLGVPEELPDLPEPTDQLFNIPAGYSASELQVYARLAVAAYRSRALRQVADVYRAADEVYGRIGYHGSIDRDDPAVEYLSEALDKADEGVPGSWLKTFTGEDA